MQCSTTFFSAQFYLSVDKYIFSGHKCIFQCTNIFFEVQMYLFSVHKFISQSTNSFLGAHTKKNKHSWGPFLESPGNVLGPELYFKIKIYRMVA